MLETERLIKKLKSRVTLMMDSVHPGGASVPPLRRHHFPSAWRWKPQTGNRERNQQMLLAKEMGFPPAGWQLSEIDVNYWCSDIQLIISYSNQPARLACLKLDWLSIVFCGSRMSSKRCLGDYNNHLRDGEIIPLTDFHRHSSEL